MISKKFVRHALFVTGLLGMAAIFSRCSATTTTTTDSTTSLTTAAKITTGLGSATTAMQSVGGAMATTSSFSTGGNTISSAATSCTVHGEPGEDSNVDGTVSDSEKYSLSHNNYALQKFYCALAATTTGPESVSGAIRTIKMVACAVEKALGSITFNNTPVALASLTIDTTCATAQNLIDMGGTSTSLTMSIPLTVTAATNPTFTEVSGNTFYSHGIRIASDDGTSLKFIILAKFDDTVAGDPIESGNFEFATYGTGTMMQGSGLDFTAGKIYKTSTTSGTLWYESRTNRIKALANSANCQPSDPAASSCGFARHTRLRTGLTFTGGSISDVSNMSGIMSDGSDTTGSGQMADSSSAVTAVGSLATEVTGKIYTLSTVSPADLGASDTFAGQFTAGTTTCIIANGAIAATGCGTPLPVTGNVKTFFNPANDAVWINYLSTHGGLGYSASTDISDAQTAL